VNAGDLLFRLKRRLVKRFSDFELHQLQSMEGAYAGASGPDLLVFGDSMMFWTTPQDGERRRLVDMIRDGVQEDLGRRVSYEALLGPGYNPRIVLPYLTALARCRSRPGVVIVPMSVLMCTSTWLAHPSYGYEQIAAELRAVVEGNGKRPQRLKRPGYEARLALDKLPAPSLIGAMRTCGELRLISSAQPTSSWQEFVKMRDMMDYYNAERLEPDSPGVLMAAEVAAMLARMEIPSVAYIIPVHRDLLRETIGDAALDHMARNAEVLKDAYLGASGGLATVVNSVFDCPGEEFFDPLHLLDAGRRRFAAQIATAVGPLLDRGAPARPATPLEESATGPV
jgi:hypothetical protein